MNLQRKNKRVNVINGILAFIGFIAIGFSLSVAGYFLLFHEDSKAQEWISGIESFYGIGEEGGETENAETK